MHCFFNDGSSGSLFFTSGAFADAEKGSPKLGDGRLKVKSDLLYRYLRLTELALI